LLAQVVVVGLIDLVVERSSEVVVEYEDVRGELFGGGLSVSVPDARTVADAGKRTGMPVAPKRFEPALESNVAPGTNTRAVGEGAPNTAPESFLSRNSFGNFLVLYGSRTKSFSNGVLSRSTTLLSVSTRLEHSLRVVAYSLLCEQPKRMRRQWKFWSYNLNSPTAVSIVPQHRQQRLRISRIVENCEVFAQLTGHLVGSADLAWTHVHEIAQRLARRKTTHKVLKLADLLYASCANECFG